METVRKSFILMALFCLILAGAVALISGRLSARVSLPVEREQTRQQELLRQAEREKRMLEEVDRLKTEFLGNISHELKTPLTVVSSRVQQARGGLDPDETDRTLKLIGGEVDRMAVMISQLMDISRIEEGRMRMDLQRESIVEIAQCTLDDYYPAFVKGGNRLIFRREGNVPEVRCDRMRVVQVLVNLISNAARHTRRGEIAVSVRASDGFAEIAVTDDGDGIPPDLMGHLFERYRSGAADGTAYGASDTGTGLGLYISKHIVEAHSGRIWVESEMGKGTCARFTLPLDT